MKILKKFALILSLVFLTGCEDSLIEMGFSKPAEQVATYNKAELSDDDVYNGIVESLADMSMVSQHKKELKRDDVSGIIEKIRLNHPEFFWIDGYTITTSGGKSEIKINIIDDYSAEETEGMFKELVSYADALVNRIPHELDNYSKVVFVHDYIINNTTYDTAGASSDKNGMWGTAYGCLVQGKAICQGYAQAFQYIMNRLGIECGVCRGNSTDGRHAWNYVNLDEKYYWIDVTWDDPVPESGNAEILTHTYCLIDDERLFRTRYTDSDLDFVPKCFSMDNNYYVRNGSYIVYYSDEAVSSILSKYSAVGEAEIMFADKNSYNDAIKRLFEDGGIWDFVDSDEITYTNDDVMYILKIKY